MFGQNKPPDFSDPKYDEKLRKYNAKRESAKVNNGGNTGVPAVPFIAFGVVILFAFILIVSMFRDDAVSPARAFGAEDITTDENYNFEIVADKEIHADTFDNVLIETEYTLFPKYESSITDLKEDVFVEDAPSYSDALKDIKTLVESGKSEVVGTDQQFFTYTDKLHPIFSNAIITMTFRSITDKDDYETVTFTVVNSNQYDSEISLAQLEEINVELATINAEKEALEEAQRIAREAEYEEEKAEQEQAEQAREDNRYVKISEENGVHRWEVLIEAGRDLRVWGTNDDFVAVRIYDEFGNRMDNDSTTASNFDFYLSTKSSSDHVVQLEVEYTSSIDYNLSVE